MPNLSSKDKKCTNYCYPNNKKANIKYSTIGIPTSDNLVFSFKNSSQNHNNNSQNFN